MNGRIYDPLLGRFLSADIVVQFAGDLQSYNRYSYVRNNPLSKTDPSGFAEGEATAQNLLSFLPVLTLALPQIGAALTVAPVPVGFVVGSGVIAKFGGYDPANAPGISTLSAIRSQNNEMAQRYGYGFGNPNSQSSETNNNQAASTAATTPKEPAEQKGEPAKVKEGSSGGQMNSQEPPNKDKETSKERRVRQQEESREKKHGDPGYEEPKSEDYGKWKAKVKEKADGKDARREAHDAKNEGGRNRTKKELDEDYETKNKPKPKKTPPPQLRKQGDEFEN